MDFPTSEAGMNYVLLASRAGTGPIIRNGVLIPLTLDLLLVRMAAGNPPGGFVGTAGVLNGTGDGFAGFSFPPGSLPAGAVGITVHFAAVSLVPPQGVRLASLGHTITVDP